MLYMLSETSQLPNQAGSWDHPDYVSISHNQVLIFAWSSLASQSGPRSFWSQSKMILDSYIVCWGDDKNSSSGIKVVIT